MIPTLMRGLNERDMQALVSTYDAKPYYYPTLFPPQESYSLTWKALAAQSGLRIAADLVARGATIDAKTREAIARIQGDIPKIAVKRTMEEDQLNEYDIMVAMTSSDPDLRRIVEVWAEDTKFCWEAVQARLEWMALQTISTGKIKLDKTNNTSVLTEFSVDYDLPDGHTLGYQTGSAAWTSGGSAKPLSVDFKNVVAKANAKGIYPKYAFMSLDTFATFAEIEEVKKASASFAVNALNVAMTPSKEQVNSAMKSLAYLKGLEIVVIDQNITIETPDGKRTDNGNPFAANVVLFAESKVMGKTFWKKPADLSLQGSAAIKALNGHTLIKKFAEEEPIQEITMGLANAFPAWLCSDRCFLMSTDSTTWNH